ncbi:DUF3742 family protein [Pseudomonas oryzihabitans]|uniref:DUF3742 family protein n=1 Tax=Pseudomonas oryzihabitans TaxID=47885 RepID=UPI001F527036|nr:DUF3742 family protein [Pseudomonas oryzihabitans]MCI1010606.1 DUF3742 family protein [Pseudomonas oryzihabitans]
MVSSAQSSASKVGLYLAKALMPLFCIERLVAKALSGFGLSTTVAHASKYLLRAVLVVFALLYSWMLVVPLVGLGLVAYIVVGGLDRNLSVASSLNTVLKECDYNGSYRDGADGYGYYDNMGLKIHD